LGLQSRWKFAVRMERVFVIDGSMWYIEVDGRCEVATGWRVVRLFSGARWCNAVNE
jgi:hypothetical protein